MVNTREQAARIQKKRHYEFGRRGLAGAVRRYLKRTGEKRMCDLP